MLNSIETGTIFWWRNNLVIDGAICPSTWLVLLWHNLKDLFLVVNFHVIVYENSIVLKLMLHYRGFICFCGHNFSWIGLRKNYILLNIKIGGSDCNFNYQWFWCFEFCLFFVFLNFDHEQTRGNLFQSCLSN